MTVRGAYAVGRERDKGEFESGESQGANSGIYGLYVQRVFEERV